MLKPIKLASLAAAIFALTGCEGWPLSLHADNEQETEQVDETEEIIVIEESSEETESVEVAAPEMEGVVESGDLESEQEMAWTSADALQAALDAQPQRIKDRYDDRHPGETLTFFGVEPGMVVVEALPGGGWYSKILMTYLGPDGTLIGAQYPDDLWEKILPNPTDEDIEAQIAAAAGWVERAEGWEIEDAPHLESYQMTTLGDDVWPAVDVILFIRALHNLNHAGDDTSYVTRTIEEAYKILKPGGIVGVVQHRAPAENSDAWADGSAGYLKQDYVIAAFEAAGFELDATSEINANPKDQPDESDFVWLLPPSYFGTEAGTPERAAVDAIGESDRMTLRFRKPG